MKYRERRKIATINIFCEGKKKIVECNAHRSSLQLVQEIALDVKIYLPLHAELAFNAKALEDESATSSTLYSVVNSKDLSSSLDVRL